MVDAKKIDFRKLEERRTQALQDKLKGQLKARQVGRNTTLRRLVLGLVVEGEYEEAGQLIGDYLEGKRMFQILQRRAAPHVTHAKDLINAIRLKRNFPNLSALPMSKQQEILDHAVSHFDELKMTLKIIEHLTRDEVVKDLRSTVWVIKSATYVIAAIVVASFVLEMSHGLQEVCWRVFNDYTDRMFEAISHFI